MIESPHLRAERARVALQARKLFVEFTASMHDMRLGDLTRAQVLGVPAPLFTTAFNYPGHEPDISDFIAAGMPRITP